MGVASSLFSRIVMLSKPASSLIIALINIQCYHQLLNICSSTATNGRSKITRSHTSQDTKARHPTVHYSASKTTSNTQRVKKTLSREMDGSLRATRNNSKNWTKYIRRMVLS